jgi:hypothetical protein
MPQKSTLARGVLNESRDDGFYLLGEGDDNGVAFFSEKGTRFDAEHYETEDEACVAFLRVVLRAHAAGVRSSAPIPPSTH